MKRKARTAIIERKTTETDIKLKLVIDGTGKSDIATGVGFFDHMLTLFAKHAQMDLSLSCKGDIEVDAHHTVEDCGIVLGQAFRDALGSKEGISRYGTQFVPMDEALVMASIDLCGRPYFVYNLELANTKTGDFDTELCEEFFLAFAMNGMFVLHVNQQYGRNTHHILEGAFKAAGRALKEAVSFDPRVTGVPSTKGVL